MAVYPHVAQLLKGVQMAVYHLVGLPPRDVLMAVSRRVARRIKVCVHQAQEPVRGHTLFMGVAILDSASMELMLMAVVSLSL